MKCEACGTEMVGYSDLMYTSIPPQYKYRCPKCGTISFSSEVPDNPCDANEMETNEGTVKYTKVWKINGKLVVADGVHEAINTYTTWYKERCWGAVEIPRIKEVVLVEDDEPLYGALIRY
jgi:hypothetical protein